MVIEPIEVKTRQGSPDVKTEAVGGGRYRLSGHAIEQLEAMLSMLEALFGGEANDWLLTRARREVLKYQLHRECFRNMEGRDWEWQRDWYFRLKAAFALPQPNIKVSWVGTVLHVLLGEFRNTEEKWDRDRPLRLVTIGAETVQRHIAPAQTSYPETDIPTDETQLDPVELLPQSPTEIVATPAATVSSTTKPRRVRKVQREKKAADDAPEAVKHKEVDRTEAQELARLFRRACQSHRIQIDECDPARAVCGPNVWRFYVRLRSGERLDRLRSALEDISREMQRSGVLVTPLPNSNEVALDVPRAQRQVVPLTRGLALLPRLTSIEQMPIAIGVTPEGADIIHDLSEMPHLLVGGTTGSGKTIFLYGLMAALLKTHPDPETLRLFISTSKPEDFIFFEELRHLETGIVSNADEAVRYLQTRAQEELGVRQRRLSEARCRDIVEYNRTHKPALPPLVVLVDEFADLADQLAHDRTGRETFYRAIRQIAQMGRNKGMHLVLCTQRPSADLVPTNIRTLMNFRVALHVTDAVASRMVLEETGAEQLQFRGDLLFKTINSLMRAQGYFVETEEIDRLMASLGQT